MKNFSLVQRLEALGHVNKSLPYLLFLVSRPCLLMLLVLLQNVSSGCKLHHHA